MPDALTIPRSPERATGATSVTPLGPATRFALSIFGVERVPSVMAGGFDLSGPIGSCRVAGTRHALHLSQHEWLLIAPLGEARHMVSEIQAPLTGVVTSLLEVSRRYVAFEVAGPKAAAVLNEGIPLDLSDAAFPAGTATSTVFGTADVVLARPGTDALYRVECARKFGPYVHDFLTEAAHAFD